MSTFEYQKGPFNHPSELAKLFTQFVNDNLSRLTNSTDREEVKKGLILQFFVGAFPELTNINEGQKEGLTNEYNLMKDLDELIEYGVKHNLKRYGPQTGGSKKKKQVHKKKSRKLN